MGYTFKKITYPVQKRRGPAPKTIAAAQETLKRLRSFLDREEPELVYFLVNLRGAQGKAITYKELRRAILAGVIDENLLEEWRQDYVKFVKEHLEPKWIEAMEDAAEEIRRRHPEWFFDPMGDGVKSWTEKRSADFVTSVTESQIEGLRAVVRRAAVLENMSVDLLAWAIRPMVGLYHQQSVANLKYFESLLANGVSNRKALEMSTRYAARMHRYRGYLIARTELAFAYNQGSYEGTKQAQEAGYMGVVIKRWCTADDERVCSVCGSLEGKVIDIDEDFYYDLKDLDGHVIGRRRINHKLMGEPQTGLVPPAHPSCRCTVMYEEIEPPEMYR